MAEEQDDLTVVYLWARKEAENEIERLRANNERLRGALRDIAELNIGGGAALAVYLARAALGEEK